MPEAATIDGVCPASVPVMEEGGDLVRDTIEARIGAFVEEIYRNNSLILRLDGYIDEDAKNAPDFPSALIDMPDGFKIDNHNIAMINKEMASVIVPIDTVLETPLPVLIGALRTFEFTHVQGVTRIVGYYSRVANWNKSKVGELRDRQGGRYGVHTGDQ